MSRATTMPSPWREAAERAGGAGALGEALGASRATLHRWAAGDVVPNEIVQRHVAAWFRRRSLPTPW